MGLGVLEYAKVEHVPGTATLSELHAAPDAEDQATSLDDGLKRDPRGHIILVPQPSDDPNDPYNWSRLRKELFTVSFVFGCGAVGGEHSPPLCVLACPPLTRILKQPPAPS